MGRQRYESKITDWITFQTDNYTGAQAEAFYLLWNLELFPTDEDGNGGANGVMLEQEGPRKCVYIEDEEAAQWLSEQFQARGLEIEVEFV